MTEAPADIEIRRARRADLAAIIAMLGDDPLGATREVVSDPPHTAYTAAFEAIDRDSNQLFVVAERAGVVIACLQLTFIPGLSRLGQWRGQIESVRVAAEGRGSGIGRRLIEWAIGECRRRPCGLVQLTSDKSRTEAVRFYEQLGFVASHEGLKLSL